MSHEEEVDEVLLGLATGDAAFGAAWEQLVALTNRVAAPLDLSVALATVGDQAERLGLSLLAEEVRQLSSRFLTMALHALNSPATEL